MSQTYPVMIGDQLIGSATMREEGLYTIFTCQCSFADQDIHRVYVQGDCGWLDLGVCYPEKGHFIVKKKIPTKSVPKGSLRLNCDIPDEETVLWKEGQITLSIQALKDAKAVYREKWNIIKTSVPSQPDSDQIPLLLNR